MRSHRGARHAHGEEELLRYAAHTPALVLINRYLPAIANRCIWLDNANAAQTATELLIRRASENCLRDGGSADRRPRAAVSGLP